MPDPAEAPDAVSTARLFQHGRSQAVRLPKAFRLPGREARVRRVGEGVLPEPIEADLDAGFARLDAFADEPSIEGGGGSSPASPEPEVAFDRARPLDPSS